MPEIATATPQMLRRLNAATVLEVIRSSNAVTVSELMDATGLTRATTISVCEDLMARGWIRELENQRDFGAYQKGRPARRFELDETAGCVLGIDVGVLKTTVVVADLRGRTIGRASKPFPGVEIEADERIRVISQTALFALEAAGAAPDSVLAVTVGLAAPVGRDGNILVSQPFWSLFDVGLKKALHDLHGWAVVLENDANLAALGERWRGSAVGVDDLVVLLAGERFGSGVIESGRLLHGTAGGAGEMAYLDMVDGVGSPHGLAALARMWAAEALAGKSKTALRTAAAPGSEVTAQHVFAAAAEGDKVALGILDRLSERLARVVSTVAILLNPELVVIGGAVAHSASALLEPTARKLAAYTATPPRLAASPLGDAIVGIGAVRHALDRVEENSLDLVLRRA
ncbi:ROK family transcriptional regulator [Arthrobacter bambusae]|uniref:ROK family transcriptional regulator n=1 Tax=Arthrobacter bambusae TaxID=1338426 RepID=UPI002785018C|nr:ROK family transcriptional regulator [Arthrobacter bambusae]MDQ0031369.1 putative NBD/HSP70 family sugar kinase [Arthrobacter bambusae]MDQ0099592.1 putative NBD/HSP70 family sugar kinase [Arthrobacter bambusae]